MTSEAEQLYREVLAHTRDSSLIGLARIDASLLNVCDSAFFVRAAANLDRALWDPKDGELQCAVRANLDVVVDRLVAVNWLDESPAWETYQFAISDLAILMRSVPKSEALLHRLAPTMTTFLDYPSHPLIHQALINVTCIYTCAVDYQVPSLVEQLEPRIHRVATQSVDGFERLEAIEALVRGKPTIGAPLLAAELTRAIIGGADGPAATGLKIATTWPQPEAAQALNDLPDSVVDAASPEIQEQITQAISATDNLWDWSNQSDSPDKEPTD